MSEKKTDKKGGESLRKWLKGDDSSLVSWLSGDVKEGSGGESLELRKKIMKLEDERARLKRELESAREGQSSAQVTLDEMLDSRPALRSKMERFRMGIDGINNKLDNLGEQLCPETQKFIAVKKRVDSIDNEMRRALRELLERPEAIEEATKSVTAVETKLEEAIPELEKEMADIETDVEQKRITDALNKEKLELMEMGGEGAEQFFDEQMRDLQNRKEERIILERDNQRLRVQLDDRNDELNRLRSLLRYKEEELVRREEDLIYRERVIEEEQKRFASEKAEVTGTDEIKLKKRLEDLKAEVHAKEEEIVKKERYLNSKMEELRRRELGLIEEEIDVREEDRRSEVGLNKVHTGNQRLTDLLLGGYPFGSSILVYGPSFVGKEVLVNQFMAEGLIKGVPILWVLTDKTPADIRNEMSFIVSGYEEYEGLGLVRYVDGYSHTVDDPADDPYTTYLNSPDDLDAMMSAVNEIADGFRSEHAYYRVGFRSLSTLIAYSNINSVFRFLNPFVGRRKKERSVSMFLLEKGMQEQQEIQMLGMIMDGMLDFTVDQQRNFFSVKGISDVQTRNDVRYTWTDRGLNIGSFTLDHIK